MPLINKIGGGGSSSKTPATGVATVQSTTKLKIDLEKSLQNFKYLIVYATASITASSNNRTILSIMNNVGGSNVPLIKESLAIKTSSLFSVISYGDVSTYDGTSAISLIYNDSNVEVVIDSSYAQVYNFNSNFPYAYMLFY